MSNLPSMAPFLTMPIIIWRCSGMLLGSCKIIWNWPIRRRTIPYSGIFPASAHTHPLRHPLHMFLIPPIVPPAENLRCMQIVSSIVVQSTHPNRHPPLHRHHHHLHHHCAHVPHQWQFCHRTHHLLADQLPPKNPPFQSVLIWKCRMLSYPIHSCFSSEVPDVRSDQIRSTDPYRIHYNKLLHSYPVHITLNTAYFLHLVYPPFWFIGYAFFRLCSTDPFHLWLISGYVYWSASLVIIFRLMIDF